MQIAKKGLFWIVLSIILIPSVFALEWPTANDFFSMYQNYYGWVDFFLAFMIFASIARLFVEKKFGIESAATKPLYVSLGLVLAIALVTWEVQSGFYLFQMGFVSLILLLILLGVIIYNLIGDKLKGKDSKLDWAHLLFSLLIIILAILLFYPGLLAYIPIANPDELMGYAAAVCGLVALWFLARWLLGRGKDKEPKGEKPPKGGKGSIPEGTIPGETGTPPTREEIEKTEKDKERIKAYIILSDDAGVKRNNFRHGERITARVIINAGRTQIKDVKLAWTITDLDTKQRLGVVPGGYFGGDMDTQTVDTALLPEKKTGFLSRGNKKEINFFVHISNPTTGAVRYVVEQKATIESSTEKPEVKKATIIVQDEKRNVGTKFTQGAKLAISVTLEKSTILLKDLKLEWILKDTSTKLNCVFSGKGSGSFGGDREIIEFDTSPANIGVISEKSKKTVDITLNISDKDTNQVLMTKKEDIKILPSATTQPEPQPGPTPPGPQPGAQPSPEQQPAPAGKAREPEIMVLESTTGRPSRTTPVPLQAKSRLIINPNQTMLNYMKTTPVQFFWYAVLSDSTGNEKGTQIPIGKNINLEIDYNTITRQKNIVKGNIYKIYCLAADSVGNWITKSDGKNYVFDFILVRIDYPSPFGPTKPGAKPEEAKEPTPQTPQKELIVRVGEETRGENRDANNPTIVKKDSRFIVGVNQKDPDFRFWWMLLDKNGNWIPVTVMLTRDLSANTIIQKVKSRIGDVKKIPGTYSLYCYLAKGEKVMEDVFDFTIIQIRNEILKEYYPGEKLPEYKEPASPIPISKNNVVESAINGYILGWLNEYINTPQYKKSRPNIKRDYTPFAKWLLSNRKATLNGKAFDLPMWIRAKYQLDVGGIKLDENYLKSRIGEILITAAEQTEKGQKVVLEKAA